MYLLLVTAGWSGRLCGAAGFDFIEEKALLSMPSQSQQRE